MFRLSAVVFALTLSAPAWSNPLNGELVQPAPVSSVIGDGKQRVEIRILALKRDGTPLDEVNFKPNPRAGETCLLYTSDAADE